MRRVSYAGASFLTTDAAADALLDLIAALGSGSTAELLELPVAGNDQKTAVVQLVVRSTSEIVSVPENDRLAEPDTADVVLNLRHRIESLAAPAHLLVAGPHVFTASDWDSLDSL